MKHYEDLVAHGCFSRNELIALVKKPSTANNIIYDYQKKGLIEKVKRDYYAVISLETKQPVLSRYQIGAYMFPDAYLTHHSAFEVYGYGSQVFYECFVATDKRFSDFEYNGVMYRRVPKRTDADVIIHGNVRVTSIEQTVVDSIRDFEKIGGLEEVIRCLMLVPGLNEQKMLECLDKNDNGFLYQKCGYIFEELSEEFHFSSAFFEECEKKASGAKRYLIKDLRECEYKESWKLYTPTSLKSLINKGVSDYDAIG